MTPFLTAKLAGKYVAVDAAGLLISTLQVSFPLKCCLRFQFVVMLISHVHSLLSEQVVLLPVLAGAFLNQYSQALVKLVSPLMPPMAVATVAILCGNAIAQSSSAILMSGGQVILASSFLHASGFFFGYVLARMLELDVSTSRTISIEVGMQVNLVFYNFIIKGRQLTTALFHHWLNSTSIYHFPLHIAELSTWGCSGYSALWRSPNCSSLCCFMCVSQYLW